VPSDRIEGENDNRRGCVVDAMVELWRTLVESMRKEAGGREFCIGRLARLKCSLEVLSERR